MKTNWQTKKLEDCIEKVVYTGKVQKADFLESGLFPIISQEQDFINGYWNNKEELFKIDRPIIIFGDHTKIFKYIDFDFVLGADGVKILQPKKDIDPKYFYYFLQSINLKSLGYARHYRLLKEEKVSYPKTLSEQLRIVKKLDALSEQTQKLESIYKKKLDVLEELKRSVLQKAFNGEL